MFAVVAVDENWGIGKDGSLLVYIKEDLKNFASLTKGKTVILGSNTLATFPGGMPLKNRLNIIMSRSKEYEFENAVAARNINDLFSKISEVDSDDVAVIGGASVYKLLLPYCNKVYVTKIKSSFNANKFFPNLDENANWKLVSESDIHVSNPETDTPKTPVEFTFCEYENVSEKTIVVINGRGGCGKDTLCEIAAKHCKVKNVSSIDPIKEIAKTAGWNGEKDPKSRKMLADLKHLFVEYNDLCTNYLLDRASEFLSGDERVMFAHIREVSEIKKFCEAAQKRGIKCVTMLVRRHTDDSYGSDAPLGNDADDCVENMEYDFVYENRKPLEQLENDFIPFFSDILLKSE